MATEKEILDRAASARVVLESRAYQEAFGKFMADIRTLRLQISPNDVTGATRLVFIEQAVEKAKRLMEAYLYDGEAAKRELEREVPTTPVGRLARKFRKG